MTARPTLAKGLPYDLAAFFSPFYMFYPCYTTQLICVVYCVFRYVCTRIFHVFATVSSDGRIRCSPALIYVGLFSCFLFLIFTTIINKIIVRY